MSNSTALANFIRYGPAFVSLAIVFFFIAVAVVAPLLAPNPLAQNYNSILVGISAAHVFGTDGLGRDVLKLMIWGTKDSLLVAAISAAVSSVIGTMVGLFSGYIGGWPEQILMKVVEYFLTVPAFFFILVVVAIYGPHFWLTTTLIGLVLWPDTARQVRAQVLRIKETEFVMAAKSIGKTRLQIMFTEVLPNAIYPAVVLASLVAARAVLLEAGLAFLGLGDPEVISWGNILNSALTESLSAWWLAVFPGLAIGILVLAMNLLGDGLNHALNPHYKIK
jgi:peptide/nickel transport system permease protein